MLSLIHKDLCCFQYETKTPIYETGYCENNHIIEKMTFSKMTIQKMATINQTVFLIYLKDNYFQNN